jgi:hypothetical protein
MSCSCAVNPANVRYISAMCMAPDGQRGWAFAALVRGTWYICTEGFTVYYLINYPVRYVDAITLSARLREAREALTLFGYLTKWPYSSISGRLTTHARAFA